MSISVSHDTTEFRHDLLGSFSGELKLALANFHEIFASLDKCLVLSENGLILVQVPQISFRRVLFDHILMMLANNLPLLTAVNTLLKIIHALLDIARQHVILVDLGTALSDDLVADLRQQALHPLRSVVVLTQLEDDSHAVQGLGQNLGNVLGLSLLNFPARLTECVQELQIVFGLFPANLDFLLEGLELLKI